MAALDARAGRTPPFWAWLAAGIAVDAACLLGLSGLGALLPQGDDHLDGDVLVLGFLWVVLSLLLTAWVSHVIVVPGILRAHGPRTGRDVLQAMLRLPLVLGCTAAFGCVVGVFLGGAAITVLIPLSMLFRPHFGTLALGFLIGSACGGIAAGSMAYSLRPVFAMPMRAPWRCRSDVAGAGLAAVLFPVGALCLLALTLHFGEAAVLTLAGTAALLPHLLLLGLDLRRAGRA